MKNEKGITLIVLVITVIVMLMITVTATYAGISTYKDMKVKNFSEELSIIRERAITVKEKANTNSEIDLSNLGKSIEDLNSDLKETVTIAINRSGESSDNLEIYRYFDSDLLKSDLDISIDNMEVVIDFDNMVVIGVNGVEYEGQVVYTQAQIDKINE